LSNTKGSTVDSRHISKEGSRHSLRECRIADQRTSNADKLQTMPTNKQRRQRKKNVRGRSGAEEEEGVEEGLTMPAKTMSAGGSAAPYM